MARDPRAIVELLLRKTVANGCTEGEARVSREKAEEMAKANGFSIDDVMPKKQWSPNERGPFESAPNGFNKDDFEEFLRKAAHMAGMDAVKRAREMAEKLRRQQAEAKAKKPQGVPPNAPRPKTVRECAEFYLKKGLTVDQTLAKCKLYFPDGKTSRASVSWYASKLRAQGFVI